MIKRTLLALALAVSVGCGPKYQASFRDFLAMKFAESSPIKVQSVSVEEISGGAVESVFSFTADYTVVDNLYVEWDVPWLARLASMENIATEPFSSETIAKLAPLMSGLEKDAKIPVLKVATKEGTRGKISGKAKATLANSGWTFQVIEASGAEVEGDRPKVTNFVVEGTPEYKEMLARNMGLCDKMEPILIAEKKLQEKTREEERIAAEKARQAKEKEDAERLAAAQAAAAKAVAERKAREKQLLEVIADGKSFYGVWQGKQARGNIGIRFGEAVKMGDQYSIEGVLFDPANPNLTKPFSATLSGNGDDSAPFVLAMRVANGVGYGEPDYNRKNQTIGFLNTSVKFDFPLSYDPEEVSFSGQLADSFMFNYQVEGPVMFMFKKDYKPKE